MRRCGCGEVVKRGGRVLRWATDEKNAVCKCKVGEVRAGLVFGKFDSVVIFSRFLLVVP